MRTRKWTRDRKRLIDLVREGETDPVKIGVLLGRSKNAINTRMQIMGLGKDDGEIAKEMRRLILLFGGYLGYKKSDFAKQYKLFLKEYRSNKF